MVDQSGLTSIRRKAGVVILSLGFLYALPSYARSGPEEMSLDAPALTQMEQRAEVAQPRDQCFLFAEVLHGWTELAGRQISAGDDQQADQTLAHIDAVAAKMEKASASDAKRLKNAEMLLEHITRRLTDMAHAASFQQRSVTQATLQRVDQLHSQVLAVLFSK